MNDERTVETSDQVEGAVATEPTDETTKDQTIGDAPVGATAESRTDAESSESEAGDSAMGDAQAGNALLPGDQSERFTSRWEEIQASFVDRPQEAVEQADALVVDLMQRVTGSLSSERERLESQWAQGEEVSTEDLRVALTRYRSFFDRLLST